MRQCCIMDTLCFLLHRPQHLHTIHSMICNTCRTSIDILDIHHRHNIRQNRDNPQNQYWHHNKKLNTRSSLFCIHADFSFLYHIRRSAPSPFSPYHPILSVIPSGSTSHLPLTSQMMRWDPRNFLPHAAGTHTQTVRSLPG